MVVEVVLGVGGFNMDKDTELTMIDVDIDIQKNDVGGEVFQVKWTG